MVPFFGVTNDLLGLVCLDSKQRVHSLADRIRRTVVEMSELMLHLRRRRRFRIPIVGNILIYEDRTLGYRWRVLEHLEARDIGTREKLYDER